MPYYIDDSRITLDDLRRRICSTDLVPSRKLLTDGIEDIFAKLNSCGIYTLKDFRSNVKSAGALIALSEKSGIDENYLAILKREVESYFSKPFALTDFINVDPNQIGKLIAADIKNIMTLYNSMETPEKREKIINSLGLTVDFVNEIFALADLTRVQWVNPLFARVLYDVGYTGAKALSSADAVNLHKEVETINAEQRYFKGKIGLADIKRVIHSAKFVF